MQNQHQVNSSAWSNKALNLPGYLPGAALEDAGFDRSRRGARVLVGAAMFYLSNQSA